MGDNMGGHVGVWIDEEFIGERCGQYWQTWRWTGDDEYSLSRLQILLAHHGTISQRQLIGRASRRLHGLRREGQRRRRRGGEEEEYCLQDIENDKFLHDLECVCCKQESWDLKVETKIHFCTNSPAKVLRSSRFFFLYLLSTILVEHLKSMDWTLQINDKTDNRVHKWAFRKFQHNKKHVCSPLQCWSPSYVLLLVLAFDDFWHIYTLDVKRVWQQFSTDGTFGRIKQGYYLF